MSTDAPSGVRRDPADESVDDLTDAERTIERLLPGSTVTLHKASREDAEFRIVLKASACRCRVDGSLTAKWLLESLSLEAAAAARSL